MATNEAFRARAARLCDLGVSQAAFAARMGVSRTWFTRWVNQKTNAPIIRADAQDAMREFLRELRDAASEDVPLPITPALPGEVKEAIFAANHERRTHTRSSKVTRARQTNRHHKKIR